MQSDFLDRTDLYRLADDGCPHVPDRDTNTHDLSDFWAALGKDDRTTR
jgi:hypothetical protein